MLDDEWSETARTQLSLGATGQIQASALLDYWSLDAFSGIEGDFDADGMLTMIDLEALQTQVAANVYRPFFELSGDRTLDVRDIDICAGYAALGC